MLNKPLTIAQILPIGFGVARPILLRERAWLRDKKQVLIRPLGVVVAAQNPDGSGLKNYEVEEASLRIAWSEKDDKDNTEEQKIELVKALLENAFNSMDFLLEERRGNNLLIMSKEYHYKLGAVYQTDSKPKTYYANLYSAFAVID